MAILCTANVSYSKECISKIKNDTLKFSIVYISPKLYADGTMDPSRYLVIAHIDSLEKQCMLSLSPDEWILLLNDTTSDYATSLLLYSFTGKDAILLLKKPRRNWVESMKEDDLEYWTEYLRKEPLVEKKEE